jgi:hypothetical protein
VTDLRNNRTPRWLQGVWRRVGRAFDGHAPEEVSDVVWAQVGRYFADVRRPAHRADGEDVQLCALDGPQAFSGRLSYSGDIATWRHDLDTTNQPRGFEESASLERKGSTVIERDPEYLELWRRVARGPALVIERADHKGAPAARIVMVAELAVAVWTGRGSGGATLRFDDGGWEVESYVGAGPIPWPAISDARGRRTPAGWSQVA